MERIVRTAARDAGIDKCVSAMTLRHAHAVHALEANENIRAIQTRLGHRSVQTTMIYLRCLVPKTQSPLDQLRLTPEPPPLFCNNELMNSCTNSLLPPSAGVRFLNFLRLRWRDAFLAIRRPSTA